MKNSFKFVLPAVLLVLAAGCARDLEYEVPSGKTVTRTYTASFDVATKTALGISGNKGSVSWEGDEDISYFSTDGGTVSHSSVVFEGNKATVSTSLGLDDDYINAVYGGSIFGSGITENSFIVQQVARSEQKDTAFAHAHACVAHLSDVFESDLHFNNIVSVLYFKSCADVQKIEFTTDTDVNGGEFISGGKNGNVRVTFENNALKTVEPASTGSKTITVITDGLSNTFHFAILPAYLSNGFTIRIYGTGGNLIKTKWTSQAVNAGISADGKLGPRVIDLGNAADWLVSTEPPVPKYPVTDMTLTPDGDVTIPVDGIAELYATITPENADTLQFSILPFETNYFSLDTVRTKANEIKITITPKAIGSASITVKPVAASGASFAQTRVITVTEAEPEDLSAYGNANCYIAPAAESTPYRFYAGVKGNGVAPYSETVAIEGAHHAAVLWENYPIYYYGQSGVRDVVSNVSYTSDGYIRFTAENEGSALIAIENSNGDILWSWHIWVWPGYDPDVNCQTYKNNVGIMMDRDLGAETNFPSAIGDYSCWGLLYQWGRKDPFFGRETRVTALGPGISAVPAAVYSNSETGTVEWTIAHPMTYILYPDNNDSDWVFGNRLNALWGTDKTMYDPCPPGWKLPYKDFWYRATGVNSTKTYTTLSNYNQGLDFAGIMTSGTESVYYPASGGYLGTIENTYAKNVYGKSWFGYWWTSGYNSANNAGTMLCINRDSKVIIPRENGGRSSAASVRCMKDGSGSSGGSTTVEVKSVTVNPNPASVAQYRSVQLSADVAPTNATNKAITWSSANVNIATVEASTGLVKGVAMGTVKIYATAANGVKGECDVTVTAPEETDLSATSYGAANCYVVSASGPYCFRAVKGNTRTAVAASYVRTLWQSYCTDSYDSEAPVINNVSYSNGTVFFSVPANMKNGNAVIAAYDSNDNILWSWHIWACKDYDPEATKHTYKNNAGVVMDRNLGATTTVGKADGSLGLLYQWGRKDPFLNSAKCHAAVNTASSSNAWTIVDQGTLDYSIKHPMAFMTSAGGDWLTESTATLWSASTKTQYDPCPPGWRVPAGGSNGLWAKAAGGTSATNAHDTGRLGVSYTIFTETGTVWVPFSGYRLFTNGNLSAIGGQLFLWSGSSKGSNAYVLFQSSGSDVLTAEDMEKASGCAVRCVHQ